MELSCNSKLLLVLSDVSFYVHSLTNKPPFPVSLVLSRPVSVEDFPGLFWETPLAADAHIFPSNDTPTGRILLDMLEQKLLEFGDSSSSSYLEFEDPNDFDFVYLMAHRRDTQGLGRFLETSNLALFKFSLQKIIGENPLTYIKNTKNVRISLMKEYQLLKAQCAQLNQSTQAFQCQLEIEKNKTKTLKDECQMAKNAVRQIQRQFEHFCSKCEYCHEKKKDMVMAPCYHLVGCKECINSQFYGSDAQTSSRIFVCFYCKKEVEQVTQIFYS